MGIISTALAAKELVHSTAAAILGLRGRM